MKSAEFVSEAYLIAFKMKGLGYLLTQDRAQNFPEDFVEAREGIGLIVTDLGRELSAIVEKADVGEGEKC